MTEDPSAELVAIGEFSRRTRLSVKALRLYHRIGLLRPSLIDEDSGYRRYRVEQVRTGQLIGLLRGAELSLEEIRLVLGDLATDRRLAAERIERLLKEIEHRHANRVLLIRHVHSTLLEGGSSMFPIKTRHVPDLRLMSIQRRLHGHETDRFVAEAKAAFAAHLDGREPTGPFMLIFHGRVDAENDGPLESVLGCRDDVQPTDLIGIRSEPAHDEAYTTITKAQWDFPAILAAYDAVACSEQVFRRPSSRLSCREVYLAEPDEITDDERICDIAFPLGDAERATARPFLRDT